MKPVYRNLNFIVASIAAVMWSGVGVLVAILLIRSVDAATEGDRNRLLLYAGITVGLAATEYIISVIYKLFSLRYGRDAVAYLKDKLFGETIRCTVTKTVRV